MKLKEENLKVISLLEKISLLNKTNQYSPYMNHMKKPYYQFSIHTLMILHSVARNLIKT